MESKEKRYDLAFTYGHGGIDYEDMAFDDYTSLELFNMRGQMHNAILDIDSELRQRGYAQDRI